MRLAVLAVTLLYGCEIRDDLVPCGELACPIGLVCTTGGCAHPESVAACEGRGDGESCQTDDIQAGTCALGSCQPAGCGNGRIDQGETCDDGNEKYGDGCSADCASLEICGNDIVDFVNGEECDSGLLGVSNDGCTSICKQEIELWRSPALVARPPGGSAEMAYDASRGVTVLFGGAENSFFSDQTWEWNGASWRRLDPPSRPNARVGATLAYDPVRERVVLFGGQEPHPGLERDDTWEWDGVDWTERTPAVSPPPRTHAAMAFDPERGVLVLFGGGKYQQYLGDTWEWDGTSWSERVLTPAPLPRHHPALAFDPIARSLVLFGGVTDPFAYLDDTWTLDATGWTEHLDTPPPARSGASLVSTATGVLLFGGMESGTPMADVWARDGTTWTPVTTSTPPPPRSLQGVSHDIMRGRVVIFGGVTASVDAIDTWELATATATWTNAMPALPVARNGHLLAYDKRRGVTVMFGGDGPGLLSDLWEWDGVSWLRRTATGPSGREAMAHTYDERRGRVVLFGGEGTLTSLRSDTWEWDGTSWTSHVVTPKPTARSAASMAYDSARGISVMFGGYDDVNTLDDTWLWDGTKWTKAQLAVRPPGRETAAIAYDPIRERVVMFGGYPSRSDTWEWDGVQWIDVTPAPPASSPRSGTGNHMAYDPLRRCMVLVSSRSGDLTTSTWEWDGTSWELRYPAVSPSPRSADGLVYDSIRREAMLYSGSTAFQDVWQHRFESGQHAPERCQLTGADTDGDGLAGCDDPDCFGRCSPFCNPGTTCDDTRPHCGDAVCGPVEDYLLCPSDCTSP